MGIDKDTLWQVRRDEQATSLNAQMINARILTQLLEVHTAVPGIIDTFDSEKQTARVRPALKMLYTPDKEAQAGDAQWVECALCVDVPVMFPGCGDYVLTFPVNQGDECLLVFAERCINHWFTQGGVQEQEELCHHDASDAIAIIGLRSQPNKIENFDTKRVQLRNTDGDTLVTLDKDGKIIAGVDGAMMTIEDGKVTVKADDIKLDGDVEITGDLTSKGDVDISGDVTGKGSADFSNDVTGAGISLQTHIHTGVQSGASTSGPPR